MLEQFRNIKNEEDILTKINSDELFNENFWELVKLLLFYNLQKYFMAEEGISIKLDQNIYDQKLFGNNLKQVSNELLEKYDILFPYPELVLKRLLIPILLAVIWITTIFYPFIIFPEILIIGGEFIFTYGFLLFVLPLVILMISFKNYFSTKRFKHCSTFQDLVEKLFVINNFKYKAANYRRLLIEINEYLKNTPPSRVGKEESHP